MTTDSTPLDATFERPSARPSRARRGPLARALFVALLVAAGAVTSVARADPAKADSLFHAGLRLFDAKDYSGAIDAFARAYREDPKEKYLWNWALCELREHRYFAALTHLRLYRRASDATSVHRDAADDLIARAQGHVGHVVIDAPAGFTVYIDGDAVGIAPTDAPMDVDPYQEHDVAAARGEVRLRTRVPPTGESTWTVHMVEPPSAPARDFAAPGRTASPGPQAAAQPVVAASRQAPTVSRGPSMATRNLTVVVAGALAVVSAAVGVTFALMARADQNQVDAYWQNLDAQARDANIPRTSICAYRPSGTCSALNDTLRTRATDSNMSTAFYVAAGSLAAAAVATFIIWPRPREERAATWVAPRIGTREAAITMGGSF